MDLNEIKNQHVHLFWGLIANFLTKTFYVGFLIGVAVELYQFFVKKEGLKLKDRLLDLSFWGLSGVLYFAMR